jgi:hypothetical protein
MSAKQWDKIREREREKKKKKVFPHTTIDVKFK